ncbi:MAG: PAS domain-containing protein [Gemmatimonadota bacterium]|nr:PAS domain-containing protein [Gemmatimonadota bacterium]
MTHPDGGLTGRIEAQRRALFAFFDSTDVMHAVVEVGGDDLTCVVINKAGAALVGLHPSAIADHRLSELGFPPALAAVLRDRAAESERTGGTVRFEQAVTLGDLGARHLRVTLRPLGPGPSGPQFVVNAEDITETTTATDALRRTERSYATLIRNLAGAVYRRRNDAAWTTEFVSDGCLPITGYRPDELVGNRIASVGGLIHPDDAPRVREAYRLSLADRRECSNEYRIVRRDHTVRWVWDRAQGVFGDDGRLEAVEGLLIDITERREEAHERRQLGDQLLHAQRLASVGRLAGGVAHDFNNLLAVVLGHADLLAADLDAAHPLHENIAEIKSAANRSIHLSRQLLGFARRQPMSPKVLDLNAALSGALNMLRRLIGESVDVVWLPTADLWSVQMDPTQLDQIVTNLALNSRDAMPGGGTLTIATRNAVLDAAFVATHRGAVAGEYAAFEVNDTGSGMDEYTLSQIFEPFFTTKGPGLGTGLGMATVYGIVKQNSGYIDIVSAPGSGTRTTVYIPRMTEAPSQPEEIPVGDDVPRGTEMILLVEDDKALLRTGQLLLRSLGYTVVATHSPLDAAVLAAANPAIDLLITDVVMPHMNGHLLAEHLRHAMPRLAVLFISGYAAIDAKALAAAPGTGFLAKPFTTAQIATKVRAVLDSRPRSPGDV